MIYTYSPLRILVAIVPDVIVRIAQRISRYRSATGSERGRLAE